MSYYSILPSQRVGNSDHSFTGQNPDPMRPLQTPQGGFRTRDVNPDELSGNQLNSLLDQNGRYIQQARARAGAAANASGLGHSSLAMSAGEGAAIQAAMPLAMQQAGAYTNVGDRNMDAENTYLLRQGDWNNAALLNRMNNSTSLNIAGMNRDEQARQFDEGTRRYDQGFAEDQRRYDTDWQRELQMGDINNNRNRNNFLASTLVNTVFSDPSIWRDPQGSMGLVNYFGSNLSTLFDQLFPSNTAQQAAP